MAAPKGNKFWMLRSKHGCDKLFTTPELLWEAACEYFAWCEDHPLISVEYNGGKRVRVPKMRAFTIEGLCLYLDCNTKYLANFENNLPEHEKDFRYICTRIRETIYQQKFQGAAAGFLNANIIARSLGLSDKQDVDHTTKGQSLNDAAAGLSFEEAYKLKYGKAPDSTAD